LVASQQASDHRSVLGVFQPAKITGQQATKFVGFSECRNEAVLVPKVGSKRLKTDRQRLQSIQAMRQAPVSKLVDRAQPFHYLAK
jgi:hypothetical protein